MAVKLSVRMAALANLVTPGTRLADVGTDHGYIPVFLCQTGKIQSAIAMDINRGPLQRAEAHVAEYGLQGKIGLRLSDGLHALAPGEADTILIAGMGGALVNRILSEGTAVLEANPELILQPQSEIPSVRAFLREIGYVIADEDCVLEDGKFYFLIKAHRLDGNAEIFTCERDAQKRMDAFGPVLLEKKHPTLRLFLERELAISQEIAGKLTEQIALFETPGADATPDGGIVLENRDESRKQKLENRLREIEEKRCLLQEALARYDSVGAEG